ncbi:TRAP transporter small permease subunit [Rhodovibrionaceae bacterium A322]
MRLIDRLSTLLGHVSAWLFFLTGAMITYEVTARYLFNAPTIWAAELSQLALIWGTFLAAALLLHRRQHIRITMILAHLGPQGRRWAEMFSLLFIAAFAAQVAWFGWEIAYDSMVRGRSTGTMMNIPNWYSEVVIPVSFALLTLQALVEFARLAAGQLPPEPDEAESLH